MKYLLDTSVFLWWAGDSGKLSPRVLQLMTQTENELYFSLACIREIQIKSQIGRLDLPRPIMDLIEQQTSENGIAVLPMNLQHMHMLTRIPNHHADPFDRMLVAQALTEAMPIITKDPIFAKYPVEVIW